MPLSMPSTGNLADGQCRMLLNSTSQVALMPQDGANLFINNVAQTIPSGGIIGTISSPANNTKYYVYAYGVSAGNIEFSTTGYSVDSFGRKFKTGDVTRRLIGMVYTNGTGQLIDTPSFRGVASYFNRSIKDLFNSATLSNYSGTSTNLGASITTLTWADDAISLQTTQFSRPPLAGNVSLYNQLIIDGTPVGLSMQIDWVSSAANYNQQASPTFSKLLAEGAHALDVYIQTGNGQTFTVTGALSGTVRI